MLREIISISGKPGLYKVISHGNRRLIVEDLTSGRRFPAMERDKIISLGDIAMYTQSEDKPLGEILDLVYASQDGKEIDIKKLADEGKLRETFRNILPEFDDERVHDSDIKKLFSWYNLLVASGMKEFAEKKDENEESASEEKTEEAKEEK